MTETSTKACASCGRPRGNSRVGWTPILRRDELSGFTCPSCPTAVEPIRRVQTRPGRVVFRARLDAVRFEQGRKRRQVCRTFATLDEAREWVSDVRDSVAESDAFGAQVPSGVETVGALCDRWISGRVDVREVTRAGYRNWLAPVRRHPIEAMPITALSIADVQDLIAWLAREGSRPRAGSSVGGPLSPGSIRSVRIALSQAIDLAVAEGSISRNVVKMAKWPKTRAKRGRDLEHWHPSELMRFRDRADADQMGGAWRLSLCGLTRADVMGLRWADVDLDAGVATISQGRVALDDGTTAVGDPKSAQRVRAVPFESIHEGSVALLRWMKAKQAADRLSAGSAWRDTGLVVVDETGAGLAPQVYSDRFRRLCTAAGVPAINLHSIRHSLAFQLHQLGVAPADAAALLGHSVEVHLATYLPHSGAAGIQAAARALGRATQAEVAAEV